MVIKTVNLETVCGITSKLPQNTKPEFAFAGKSNVGKSTMINALMNRKAYARTSATPGKTRLINLYLINQQLILTDLPGYGFAKVSAQEHERWSKLMDSYFEGERDHALVVCLVDIRHDASPLDVQMIAYLHKLGLPFAIVFTKADKVSRGKQQQQVRTLCRQLEAPGDTPILVCSAQTGQGIDTLKNLIAAATGQ